jgi:hypothetical protein
MKASILRIPVSGLSHIKNAGILNSIEKGSHLYLKPIHDNAYDEYAVAVCADEECEHQLGWIPKGPNIVIHNLIEAGYNISAVCTGNDPAANSAVRLHVMVWLDTEAEEV